MLVVAAIGGNALLRRRQSMTVENQRENVGLAAQSLAAVVRAGHDLIVTHGNGPQVGLLALQAAAYSPTESYPLDVLNAESEGMIGYLIEQQLGALLPPDRSCATLLTQVEVDPADRAFVQPTKPIGPIYQKAQAEKLAKELNWSIAPDGDGWRRVVASPLPKRIIELQAIELLVSKRVVVICTGGGGIPVIVRPDGGLVGVEAVIDKDWASALLARQLGARALLLLTDVPAVYTDWDTPQARRIHRASPDVMATFEFAAGSIGPKVQAACAFVRETGGFAGIGRLEDAIGILDKRNGTILTNEAKNLDWHSGQYADL